MADQGWDTPFIQSLFDGIGGSAAPDGVASEAIPVDSPQTTEPSNAEAAVHHRESMMLLGRSSEFDPFLRNFYNYNSNGRYTSRLRGFHKPAYDGSSPIVMLVPNETAQRTSKTLFSEPDHKIMQDLDPYRSRLLALFGQFVGSAYPLLTLPADDELKESPALLATMYILALPWRSHDAGLPWAQFASTTKHTALTDLPDIAALYRYAWDRICDEMHCPTLSTVQACLMFMEREAADTFVSHTPFDLSVANAALTLALSMGLNRNPLHWRCSAEEKRRRIHLWWATSIHCTWTAAINGQPCLLANVHVDVPPLSEVRSEFGQHENAWLRMEQLATLTIILQDILTLIDDFDRHSNTTIHHAEHLHATLEECKANIDSTNFAMDGKQGQSTSELSLAWLYCKMITFRATLQQSYDSQAFHGLLADSVAFLDDTLMPIVESISLPALESFWLSWSRSYFATAADFCILLQILSTDTAHQQRASDIGSRYRQWLWLYSKSHKLTRMGMARYDTLQKAMHSGQLGRWANLQV